MKRQSCQTHLLGFTDYPIKALCDRVGEWAPIRPAQILAYDQARYLLVSILGFREHIKVDYLRKSLDLNELFEHEELLTLPNQFDDLTVSLPRTGLLRCDNWHPIFTAYLTVRGLASHDMIEWLDRFESMGGYYTWSNRNLWFESEDHAMEFYFRFK